MDTANPLPSKIGKYEILGVLGRGGMGVVYKARDPYIDRIVAVKTIRFDAEDDDDHAGRLRMEARSAGKLHHPNVVTIFDFGEEGNLSYIVMEFVEGINLSRIIQTRRVIPLAAKLDVLMQVARGVAYAHEHGVVHRDMKPSNICVTARGVAKVLDFGLVRFDNTRLTKSGYLSGTIAYMSPERFSGETGPQDDIFALGAVAYELLAYRQAFPGETTAEIIGKILGGPMPPSIAEQTGYPTEVDGIVLRALDRDPAARYASAAAFEEAVESFTRSDEYRKVIAREGPDDAVDWSDDTDRRSGNPYSSGRSKPSFGDSPTLQVASENAIALATDVILPPGDPTLLKTKRHAGSGGRPDEATLPAVDRNAESLVATQVITQRPRRTMTWVVIASVVVIGVIAAALLMPGSRTTQPSVSRPSPPMHTKPETAPSDTSSQLSEVQLATATTLAGIVGKRQLSADEKRRFDEANGQLDRARENIAHKDYSAGAALATQATEGFRNLLASNEVPAPSPDHPQTRPRHVPAPKPADTSKPADTKVAVSDSPPVRTTRPPPAVETSLPAPVIVATQPQKVETPPKKVETPPKVETPAPQPARPTRAELEREVNTFMHDVAVAYQDKDVAFFRQRALNFSDQLAGAIRNSPSTRVTIAVENIQFTDDQNASVTVRRTDTFAEAGMPAGVQTLVYELRRQPDGWKIVHFAKS